MATQVEFVNKFSKKGYTKRDSNIIIDDFIDTIIEFLECGDSVSFRDFGKFEVRSRKERESYSVRTGQRVTVGPYNVVHFTTGKFLKEVINGKRVNSSVDKD